MSAHLLALASAMVYGTGDFLGGLSTRRAPALLVITVGQAAGLAVLVGMMLVSAPAHPVAADLAWGAVAGLFGGVGMALLYYALAIGSMSVVAPTTAVCAVAVPVLWEVRWGDAPGAQAAVGIGMAIVAIVLISTQSDADPERTERATPDEPARRAGRAPAGFGTALVSGVLIGGFFLALANTTTEAGWWPLLAARTASVTCFAVAMVVTRRSWRVAGATGLLIVSGGVLDMLANALYLLAMRGGPLASIVTLASLYPASTVLLARGVLGERVTRVQAAGIVAALVAVTVIVSAP